MTDYLTRADSEEVSYRRAGAATPWADTLFVNETDYATRSAGSLFTALRGTNTYLRPISSVSGSDADPVVNVFVD